MAQPQDGNIVMPQHIKQLSEATLAALREICFIIPDSEIVQCEESRAALRKVRIPTTDAQIAQAEEQRHAALRRIRFQITDAELADLEKAEYENRTAGSHPPGPTQRRPPETVNQGEGGTVMQDEEFRVLLRQISHLLAWDLWRESRHHEKGTVNKTTSTGNREARGESRPVETASQDDGSRALFSCSIGKRS